MNENQLKAISKAVLQDVICNSTIRRMCVDCGVSGTEMTQVLNFLEPLTLQLDEEEEMLSYLKNHCLIRYRWENLWII